MSGIFVGYSDRVDGALFYCPHTKQTYETADYKLAPSLPTGAFFRLPYDGGLFFGLYDSPLTTPEPFPPGSSVSYLAPSATAPVPAHVISVPLSPTASGRPVVDASPSYRLRLSDGALVDAAADALSPREDDPAPSPSSAPTTTAPSGSPPLPSWLKHDAKVSYVLDGHTATGKLEHSSSGWTFVVPSRHGRRSQRFPIH